MSHKYNFILYIKFSLRKWFFFIIIIFNNNYVLTDTIGADKWKRKEAEGIQIFLMSKKKMTLTFLSFNKIACYLEQDNRIKFSFWTKNFLNQNKKNIKK